MFSATRNQEGEEVCSYTAGIPRVSAQKSLTFNLHNHDSVRFQVASCFVFLFAFIGSLPYLNSLRVVQQGLSYKELQPLLGTIRKVMFAIVFVFHELKNLQL